MGRETGMGTLTRCVGTGSPSLHDLTAPLTRLNATAGVAWARGARTAVVLGDSAPELSALVGRLLADLPDCTVQCLLAATLSYCPDLLERTVARARTEPTVLVVQNLHEAGFDDVCVLLDALTRLRGHRLLTVLTACPPDEGSPQEEVLPLFLHRVADLPRVSTIRLDQQPLEHAVLA